MNNIITYFINYGSKIFQLVQITGAVCVYPVRYAKNVNEIEFVRDVPCRMSFTTAAVEVYSFFYNTFPS